MTNEEIYSLPVKDIADKNCLLFLWVTSPKLDIGIECIRRWGFKYKTIGFSWYKQAHMPGNYTISYFELCLLGIEETDDRCQCPYLSLNGYDIADETELCLIGGRGSIPKPRGSRNEKQLISEKRGKHSEKPEEARIRIERMFPTQKKLEMFARRKLPGWDAIGYGVDGLDIRESLKNVAEA